MRQIDTFWIRVRQVLHWFLNGSHAGGPSAHPTTKIFKIENIDYDPKSGNIFRQSGCIYNAAAKINIGRHTWIGPNVGLITQNHNPTNPDEIMSPEPIAIGDYSWIGMNAVILPGVVLGDHTTVGAGSVVTKSFPEGNCVIAGNPAKIIRRL